MSKVHFINAGPGVVVIHTQGGDGRSKESSREVLPGEHVELDAVGGRYLTIVTRDPLET
jgi:hypothetical protein